MLLRLKDFLLETIFPIRCVGCGEEGEWLCRNCAAKIRLNEKQSCPVCRQPSPRGKVCEKCESPLAGLRVAASYERNPELAKAVKALKYKFSENLAQNLAEILSRSFTPGDYSGAVVVSFVPLHKRRQRWRGFNQAELLARAVGRKFHLPVEPLLVRQKNTPQQARLPRADRLKNLADAFAVAPNSNLAGKTIILVDDVATTGTTLIEAAKTLKKHGVKEVWGLVLARG